MKRSFYRILPPLLCLFIGVFLVGCAAQKSMIVLLPEDGKVSGEVMVENAQGAQLLNRSWQSVEIAGPQGQPARPIVLDKKSVQDDFGGVMADMPLQPVHFLLYFKRDSAELLPDSKLLLPAIAKAVKERHPAQLSIVGHTDTRHSKEYNCKLGLRRATEVSRLLVSYGADPASIETSSRGKSDLLVKTPDQTLEPRNRRVEVTVR